MVRKENELERLTEKFKGNFKLIDIREDGVYGYTENSKKYLGSLAEYIKYKRMQMRSKNSDYTPAQNSVLEDEFDFE